MWLLWLGESFSPFQQVGIAAMKVRKMRVSVFRLRPNKVQYFLLSKLTKCNSYKVTVLSRKE